MFSARTFDKQLMDSASHALEVHHYLGGNMGVMKGCDVTENVDGNLEISAGAFIVMGRQIEVISTEVVTVPVVASGTLYSILIFEIDLTQTNTETQFLQGSFKIVSNAVAYPTLIQQDLTDGGTLYQFEFARFENTVVGVGSLSESNKEILDMPQYLTALMLKTINGESIVGVGNLVINSIPSGAIQAFAMTTAPSGWLKANGSAVSRTTYSELFAAIGTTFGVGDGSTTFNLPDLRGEFIRGYDDSRGVDSGRSFGSSQLDQFQGHYHNLREGTNDGTATASTNADAATNIDANAQGVVTYPVTDGVSGTPRWGSETRPRNIAMLYCIKY